MCAGTRAKGGFETQNLKYDREMWCKFLTDGQCRNRNGEFHFQIAVLLQLSYRLSLQLACETGFELKT